MNRSVGRRERRPAGRAYRTGGIAVIAALATIGSTGQMVSAAPDDGGHRAFTEIDLGAMGGEGLRFTPAAESNRPVSVMLEMQGQPVAVRETSAQERGRALSKQNERAIAAQLKGRQDQIRSGISRAGGTVVAQLQWAYNGVQVEVRQKDIPRLAALPGVVGVREIQTFEPDNSAGVPYIGGPEVWEDTEGKITHFVAGIGTGGTISVTGRYLKEKNPKVKIIGADPYGSIFKTYKESGHVPESTPYLVEGIGQSLPIDNADMKIIDEIINVTDRDSFELARDLSRREGIFCGGSTGTNFAAALKVAKEADENAVIVFIVCDTGEHYLSKFHSDEWMKEKLLLEPQRMTASLIAETKNSGAPEQLIYVSPDEIVSSALSLMDENGVTQIPVLENYQSVGSLRESHVLAKLLVDRDLLDARVGDVMDKSFPVVDMDTNIADIKNKLTKSPAVLVEDFKRITAIITRSDVLDIQT